MSGKRGLQVAMTMGDDAPKNTLNPNFASPSNATVQVGIVQGVAERAANGPPNMRATILWNIDGVSVSRMISVGGGSSISGGGDGVAVSLFDVSKGVSDPTLADYEVTVDVVPGVRAPSSVPPTLIPLISEANYSGTPPVPNVPGTYLLTNGQDVSVKVPPGSGAQSVYIHPGLVVPGLTPPGVGYYVVQRDAAGAVLALYTPSIGQGFVPLSPFCTNVIIVNKSGDSIGGIHLLWGIDG